ncbi:TetR/AcrR family transcriptional regulator [Moritella viscosa]|uniref:Transcriptional regulator, TetR family n=1 Tax=Moritella viscosa TaxID=80854 RepID=A0A090IIB6_9GAMM|nr:TetR/AcrR family transcriptional regulator [Moritella viscosa]CED60882.1 HTH-type transcriptional regulator, TetR family [Moritella viscosa]SGY95989.1 Transcriptional regulator, TetR family [Moritella viscosa]SGZ08249.1 Transcriptional regulator, TetR family [Moritella viscosa]SGZ08344.1 Transcriptional regulator, TetR family [Moritella viscosa]SHO10344.1 Transcriptional regulator, TetR family [Moritella viscosa]
MVFDSVNGKFQDVREKDIMNAAITLISEIGIVNLTMDKLVAKVPFSKGTVYKYFSGKEDLLLAISNYSIAMLSGFFSRAAQFEGESRERILLLNFAYLIYALLHPVLFQTVICSKSPNVYGKASANRLQDQKHLESNLLSISRGVVQEALDNKNLIRPEHMSIEQLCFSNWSMGYGIVLLLSGTVHECSNRAGFVIEQELFNQNNLLFDGLGWQPLSNQKDYRTVLNKSLQVVFPNELALLKKKGCDLHI